METATAATTLQKKKINKGKLKKTIKNVLCRPDPVFWPIVTDDQKEIIESALSKYKVQIPDYKKPHWKEIQSIPKEKRPKPPNIEKVEGLLFGISQCSNLMYDGQCSAIMIEASVNPRSIVQPLLEACISKNIPIICFEGLKETTANYFGIPTSCLGVKKDCLKEISEKVFQFGHDKLPRETPLKHKVKISKIHEASTMETQESTNFEYLYRSNKKSRVFVPPATGKTSKVTKEFTGQDFIEFTDKQENQDKKSFMKMIVKKISNNPKRVKVK